MNVISFYLPNSLFGLSHSRPLDSKLSVQLFFVQFSIFNFLLSSLSLSLYTGFLPAQVDGSLRGNYGLMDQVAALHWVQENIGEFGGNAENVTVIGHGTGAACVHLLMLSPMAKGRLFFQKQIFLHCLA